ncbi:Aspartate aminotransferase, cytoplasmic [Diplodia seriata]|uniref:Aspartate aminotransferase n=1 Tax=Diplodia seriata TaxID=420778 RepID=A0A1S8BHV9_9PEZI|nr:Aspartate aminotransferase, cytoplasmic [Diplodia seriata]
MPPPTPSFPPASADPTSVAPSPQSTSSRSRLQQLSAHMSPAKSSVFQADVVPKAPEDPLFGLMAAYRADTDPKKVDLGIGAYRDNTAKPWVLPVVKKVSAQPLVPTPPRHGAVSAQQWALTGSDPIVTSLQTISGTGAVHLGALFLARFYNTKADKTVYFSNPTWANHNQIFTNVAFPVKTYPYFSTKTRGLDFDGMLSTIKGAPEGSIILLHACAHNPTGVDPTQEQWKAIAEVIREKNHFPFFDCAYQGFASGDLAKDGWAIRYFVEQGFELVIAQSYAKNFGLYGERAGCFHFVTAPGSNASDVVDRVDSQLKILQRSEISNPPIYGAKIASTVLNDPALFEEWKDNLRTMSGRIIDMRKALRSKLEELGTPGTWNHITDQIGMFSFTGLTEKQVLKIRADAHVYMTKNGRISMAGLNTNNVDYVANAIDKVVREA